MILLIVVLAGGLAVIVIAVQHLRSGRSVPIAVPVMIRSVPGRTPMLIEVPAAPCIAWLFVEDGPTMQGDTIPLRSLEIMVGASTAGDIVLEGENVPGLACRIGFTSDSHAVLTVERGARVAINGCYVLQHLLHARDVITIDLYSFIYFDSTWRA
jgi:hypothetical protein